MSVIKSLQLSHYRNYEQAALDHIHDRFVVLYGANGAGKTNMLEAASLFTPGRGLRRAKYQDLQNVDHASVPWALSARIDTRYGEVRVGTGRQDQQDKRIVKIQGEAVPQNRLSEYLSCIWLTPQMDRLFLDPAATRRRFLDRLVMTFDPGHSGRVTRFENAMRQRSKLLQEGKNDPSWLEGLEVTMAESAVAIAAARTDYVHKLQNAAKLTVKSDDLFPHAVFRLQGTLENLLDRESPALEVEDLYRHQLRASRDQDALTGGAATGPHKTDLLVRHLEKDMPADQCSTGEQKALLIGIVLSHGRLLSAEACDPPLFLLDEVVAHLDEKRREALFQILSAFGAQIWLTGTERTLFDALSPEASFFRIEAHRAYEEAA